MSTEVMETASFYPGASRCQTKQPSSTAFEHGDDLADALDDLLRLRDLVLAERAVVGGVDLHEAPALAVRAQRQHQQRVEPEPLEQRGLGRVGSWIGAADDTGLATADHL